MNSRSNSNKFAIERMPQPRTLKEFLKDDDSCSSSGFKSLPRRLPHSDHNPQPPPLRRSCSRSRAAAEAAISSFQKLLKSLHLITSSPPPETLSRSFSKRLFRWSSSSSAKKKKKNSPEFDRRHSSSSEGNNYSNKVKVKDILKWRSFRDVAVDAAAEEVKSEQLESAAAARSESESSGSGSGSGSGGEGWWRWGGDSENSFTTAELPGGDNYLLGGEEGKSGKCNKSNNYADVDGGGGDLVRGTTEAAESTTVEVRFSIFIFVIGVFICFLLLIGLVNPITLSCLLLES